jgi:hypothetical protein
MASRERTVNEIRVVRGCHRLGSTLEDSSIGVVGKWHLGLGRGTIDWNGVINPGPPEVGFHYSFIIPATTDRVPPVFVENHRVANLDPGDPIKASYEGSIGKEATGLSHPELLKMKADTQHSNAIINGISRIGYMTGGKSRKRAAAICWKKRLHWHCVKGIGSIFRRRKKHPRLVEKQKSGNRPTAGATVI